MGNTPACCYKEDGTKRRRPSPAPADDQPELPPDAYVPFTVQVKVLGISGSDSSFESMSNTYVKDVKLQIEAKCQFPAMCQQLALDTTVLSDTEYIGKYCSAEDPQMSLTIVKSLGKLYDRKKLKMEEVNALRQMGLNDDKAVESLGRCVQVKTKHKKGLDQNDQRTEIRRAAFEALVHLGKQGDTNAVDAFIKFISCEDVAIRQCGVVGVEQCCKDDVSASGKLLAMMIKEAPVLGELEGSSKVMAAAGALSKIARPGDVDIAPFLQLILPHLHEYGDSVIVALLDCLSGLIHVSDTKTLEAIADAISRLISYAKPEEATYEI